MRETTQPQDDRNRTARRAAGPRAVTSSETEAALSLPPLPVRGTAPPQTALGRWMFAHGESPQGGAEQDVGQPWYAVMWLTGVDYFSTLGYQPGIALLAAGVLSPAATGVLILMTLFAALPVYCAVARQSYVGQGSIAMLERLVPGWSGKLFVLALLGFASTDFVITMTLSAADATRHMIANPYLHSALAGHAMAITLGLLALLAAVFLAGFREAIGIAIVVAVPYLLLNLAVIARGFVDILSHPALLTHWSRSVAGYGDWPMILLTAGIIFPRLALGLSGFETGVSVMPLVRGNPPDAPGVVPEGRIRATRKLLAGAAGIMVVMLLTSSFVTTLLVPESAYRIGGPAAGRALAYLAHRRMGSVFGTVYDLSTILILWFAGASAMTGMLSLIPRYLPRFGMAPRWAAYARPLVVVLYVVDVLVTVAFHADVESQAGAYATGVLALMLSAAVAVALSRWSVGRQSEPKRVPIDSIYFWIVTLVFAYTLAQNVRERPDGVIIAGLFIAAILLVSALYRYFRATEMRAESIAFADVESEALWPEMAGKKIHLVPVRRMDKRSRERKIAEIHTHYQAASPLAFLYVELPDDRSDFTARMRLTVRRWGDHYIIHVSRAVAIANTIAYVSELLDPISIFMSLTRRNRMGQAMSYILSGQGEVGVLVYDILVHYWEWTPPGDVRPRIFLMSE